VAMPTMASPIPTPVPPSTSVAAMTAMPQQKLGDGGVAQAQGGGTFDMARAPSLTTPWFARQEARSLHVGPVLSSVPGRTDAHKIKVPSGSYVLPAQHIASIGQGNTMAGMSVASKMFSGPYGASGGKIAHGPGAPHAPKPMQFAQGGIANVPVSPSIVPDGAVDSFNKRFNGVSPEGDPNLMEYDPGNVGKDIRDPGSDPTQRQYYHQRVKVADDSSQGGSRGEEGDYEPVDVDVSGGEYIVPPWAIKTRYGGNLQNGHNILDRWVMDTRKKEIETQRKLPPPAKE
jgi:hypothetical protein